MFRKHTKIIKIIAVSLFLLNCGESFDNSSKKDSEPLFKIEITKDGKADNLNGMLSGAELRRIETAFNNIIDAAEKTINTLTVEIAELESENRRKANEINSIVAKMEVRKGELETQHNQNSLICLYFASPACFLAASIDNDNRMNRLKADLSDAKSEQRAINGQIRKYEKEKELLLLELAPVQESRDRLISSLRRGGSEGGIPEILSDDRELADAYSRIKVLNELSSITHKEVVILVDIRNRAASLAQRLDASLEVIRALATSIDKLVQESRDQFMDLLKSIITGDSDPDFDRWLEDAIAEKTEIMLDELDWPTRDFVTHIMKNADSDDPETQEMFKKILGKLRANEISNLESNVNVNILDHTAAESTIFVDEIDHDVRVVVIALDIEHSYIGDLTVTVNLPNFDAVTLHARTGRDTNDIVQTYEFPLPESLDSVVGEWTLTVEDHVDDDQGKLNFWSLSFEKGCSQSLLTELIFTDFPCE